MNDEAGAAAGSDRLLDKSADTVAPHATGEAELLPTVGRMDGGPS